MLEFFHNNLAEFFIALGILLMAIEAASWALLLFSCFLLAQVPY
ncbi:hypothetical protein ACFQMB_03845 [Pseudobowmanella zhangzhouensis]